jgi:hypothetical protein
MLRIDTDQLYVHACLLQPKAWKRLDKKYPIYVLLIMHRPKCYDSMPYGTQYIQALEQVIGDI